MRWIKFNRDAQRQIGSFDLSDKEIEVIADRLAKTDVETGAGYFPSPILYLMSLD